MSINNFQLISSDEPTYWSTDIRKTTNQIDFCIINELYVETTLKNECFEVSLENLPVIVAFGKKIIKITRSLDDERNNKIKITQ